MQTAEQATCTSGIPIFTGIPQAWKALIIVVLALGICFRCVNLEGKVFWVDEVATAIRVAGYTRAEVTEAIAQMPTISVETLRGFQRINPQKNFADSLAALSKSPEHAPLYFILTRLWTQLWGSSITTLRSLSTVFSVVSLVGVFWLARELFLSQSTAAIALALLSVSPFFISYAQEARPYSLWTALLLFCAIALLRANRLNTASAWAVYSLTLALNFYTSLLSLLVGTGHAIYVWAQNGGRMTAATKRFALAFAAALVAFAPWLWVIAQQWQRLQDNTTWMRLPMNWLAMVAVWLYSLLIPFADLPVSTALSPQLVLGLVVSLALLGLMGRSLYFVCQNTPRRVWLFVITLICTTPIVLVLIDLASGGQASATSRYLIPSQLGVLLAIAHCLAQNLLPAEHVKRSGDALAWSASRHSPRNRFLWQLGFALLLCIAVGSCIKNLERSPMYQKSRNIHNIPIAAIVNQAAQPTLLVEPKSTMDLLSLSHSLNLNVQIRPISDSVNPSSVVEGRNVFLFNPSKTLLKNLQKTNQNTLTEIYHPSLLTADDAYLSLWSVQSNQP